MQEKARARLGELARGSPEAGFTQPNIHIFLHVCTTSRTESYEARANEECRKSRAERAAITSRHKVHEEESILLPFLSLNFGGDSGVYLL